MGAVVRRLMPAAALASGVLLLAPVAARAEPSAPTVSVIATGEWLGTTETATGDLSCPSTVTCTSVLPRSGASPAADDSTMGEWNGPTTITSTSPSGSTLWAVSCPAAGACVAVGYESEDDAGPHQPESTYPVVAAEDAGAWGSVQQVSAPVSPSLPYEDAWLTAVQCFSGGDCVAVGDSAEGQQVQPFELTEAGGSWSPPTMLTDAPLLFGGAGAQVTSLSCSDASDCTATGFDADQTSSHAQENATFAWTETAGTWATPTQIGTTDGFRGESVACSAAGNCLVVGAGGYEQGGWISRPAYALEVDGTWSPVRVLALPSLYPDPTSGAFTTVSCPSATLCVAGGQFDTSSSTFAATATWSDGTWSSASLLRVLSGPTFGYPEGTWIGGLSCPSVSSCTVDGFAGLVPATGSYVEAQDFAASIMPVGPVGAPGAPVRLVVSGRPYGIVARWTGPMQDGGSPVRSYTARIVGTDDECTSTGYACTIHVLRNGERYRVEVTDTTTGGTSPPTVAGYEPLVGGVPTPPTDVSVTPGGRAMTVHWVRGSTPRGERLLSYVVTLRGPGGWTGTVAVRGTSARIALVPGTGGLVTVSVRARDVNGWSRPSAPVTIRF